MKIHGSVITPLGGRKIYCCIYSVFAIYIAIRMSKSLYNHLGMMNRFLIGFLLPPPCCAHFLFLFKKKLYCYCWLQHTNEITELRPKGRGRPQRILTGSWPEEHVHGVIRAVVFRDPSSLPRHIDREDASKLTANRSSSANSNMGRMLTVPPPQTMQVLYIISVFLKSQMKRVSFELLSLRKKKKQVASP